MKPMERVVQAMQHGNPDRVPVYPIVSGVTRNYVGATYEQWSTDADLCARALLAAADDLELDCLVTFCLLYTSKSSLFATS